MKRTQRISIVLPDLRGGGVERVRLILAREFLERGYAVEFALMRMRGELLPEVPPDCDVLDLQAPRVRNVLPALHSYFKQTNADAILAAMWPLSGLACLAKRTSGSNARLVVSEHNDFRKAPAITGPERFALKIAGSAIYSSADKVVAVSSGLAESLVLCAGLHEDTISVIHNPIRTPSESKVLESDAALLTSWSRGRRLLAMGSLKPQKGFDLLIEAMAQLDPNIQLIILGEGDLRSELEAQVERLGLSSRIWLPGFRSDPFPFLRQAELFVLSSRWEGFGNVIVEALACGTPVVSTDCQSGPAEILHQGRFGCLVAVENAPALADGIAMSFAGKHCPEILRNRADEFSAERAAAKYLDLLFPNGS